MLIYIVIFINYIDIYINCGRTYILSQFITIQSGNLCGVLMPEIRKIQKTGGSTFIVSLPKEWAKNNVKRGDGVTITTLGDSLIISTKHEHEKSKQVSVPYHKENLDCLLRLVIGYYLVGYNTIRIVSEHVFRDRDKIKDVIKRSVIGLEIIKESGHEMVFQNFLKYDDLPLTQTISRIHTITCSMYADILKALTYQQPIKTKHILRDVIKRENEVDRFYLLGVRQLKSAIYNKEVGEKLIANPIDCLGYRIVIKSIERIGDHIENIAVNLLKIKNLQKYSHIIQDILGLGQTIHRNCIKAMKSLLKNNKELAEQSIEESKKANEMEIEIVRKIVKLPTDTAICFSSVVDSFKRIAEYSNDIGEITINIACREK